MLELAEQLGNALKDTVNKHQIKGVITGVARNVTDKNCDVEREGESTLQDVRLQATEESLTSKIIIKPKEGSVVICAIIENLRSEACVIMCSEIDEVLIKIETVEFRINAAGITMKKGADSLKDALTMMNQATSQIVVLTGTSPDYVKLQQALMKLTNIFH